MSIFTGILKGCADSGEQVCMYLKDKRFIGTVRCVNLEENYFSMNTLACSEFGSTMKVKLHGKISAITAFETKN